MLSCVCVHVTSICASSSDSPAKQDSDENTCVGICRFTGSSVHKHTHVRSKMTVWRYVCVYEDATEK